jgi:hypothetical protein
MKTKSKYKECYEIAMRPHIKEIVSRLKVKDDWVSAQQREHAVLESVDPRND